ncbi:hypothetical protein GALMADRAFT_1246753 [Galerina marginata CBS 339.88]|uniref:Uncharacterized protein n=1 Tax=Galerina marginata (strain CBS 339.88) TaxID=685588 RepID=A0A067T8W9_GALM3|nr:hypothetical protein GALMADRAFT_1246753 [Galerina marginata CBS 339.88]
MVLELPESIFAPFALSSGTAAATAADRCLRLQATGLTAARSLPRLGPSRSVAVQHSTLSFSPYYLISGANSAWLTFPAADNSVRSDSGLMVLASLPADVRSASVPLLLLLPLFGGSPSACQGERLMMMELELESGGLE